MLCKYLNENYMVGYMQTGQASIRSRCMGREGYMPKEEKFMNRSKAFIKSMCTEIKENLAPYKWEYLFGSIFVGIILFSTMYEDFFATYRHGLNFWYALSEGHPLSFYSYAKEIAGATLNRGIKCGAAYDFTIYGIFAIWNFPAWIYEKLSGNSAESCLLCLIWGKLLLAAVAVSSAAGVKKIYEFITGDREGSKTVLFVYLFSGILIVSAFFIGQYDIIGVMFAVYGVYYYLKGDYRKFYLLFALAITCKYFALLLFVCLVLLYEKRILYIIRDMALGCWLVLAEKLLFSLGKSYAEIHPEVEMAARSGKKIVATGILSSRMGYLFSLQYHMGVDSISIFVVAIGLLLAYCYLQKREENYAFYYKTVYVSFAVNIFFIIFTASTPYWAVLTVPWLVLMIYCNGENIKLNMIAETIGSCAFLVWHMGREPYFFKSSCCEGMLMYYLLGKPYFYINGMGDAMSVLMEGTLATMFNFCRYAFYTCMLVLVVINFPRANKMGYVKKPQEAGMRGLLAFREVCVIGIILLPIIVYIVQVVCARQIMDANFSSDTVMKIMQLLRE